jgi:hypothetical protein
VAEYLAPGVYIEETSFRSKTIEGVSTSTAGFVGPTRFGPIRGEPELLTSFADFERIYGGLDQLQFNGGTQHNFVAHAVRAFFEQGGRRLYVSRVYNRGSGTGDGRASRDITDGTGRSITLRARYPGVAGNATVTFAFRLGQNILNEADGVPVLRGASEYDVVWVRDVTSPIESPPLGSGRLFWLERFFDNTNRRWTFRLRRDDPSQEPTDALALISLTATGVARDDVRVLSVNVSVGPMGQFDQERTWENLSFHPEHRSALGRIFDAEPPISRATALYVPIEFVTSLANGVAIAETLLSQPSAVVASLPPTILDTLDDAQVSDTARTFQVRLDQGSDGQRPLASDYEGDDGADDGLKSGFRAFEDIEDISIVAAPGSSFGYENGYRDNADTILNHLISHAQRMRYRVAVLDAANGHLISQVRAYRGRLDSTHAAMYYPWVSILDPVTQREIQLPPSGFVAGIYARNDVEHGVHKAPANEVVLGAIGFELLLNKAQQEVLNPEGINCFRFFEGRGFRLWGARTISSDPEWKYLNVRRYFAYLERSIERGTQWVVFENNGDPLWANVRRTIEDFLFNEWKSERLMGTKPEEAYFVRCDRSTMTQNDIDNGRLICLVGVAPLKPAEFVIFRIGQWTADRRS